MRKIRIESTTELREEEKKNSHRQTQTHTQTLKNGSRPMELN